MYVVNKTGMFDRIDEKINMRNMLIRLYKNVYSDKKYPFMLLNIVHKLH